MIDYWLILKNYKITLRSERINSYSSKLIPGSFLDKIFLIQVI